MAAVAGLASCTTEDVHRETPVLTDGTIVFDATTAPATSVTRGADALTLNGYTKPLWLLSSAVPTDAAAATRGTQLGGSDVMSHFGVSAYLQESTGDVSQKTPDYFYNLKAVRDEQSGRYGFGQDYYWPASNEALTFMAYYPYNSGTGADGDNTLVTLSPRTQAGVQTIEFEVAAANGDQVDFMTATTPRVMPSTSGTPVVNLKFRHQLAAIRFAIGSQFPTKGFIQKIALKNVYKKGTYTFSEVSNTDGEWTLEAADRDNFEVGYSVDRAVNAAGEDVSANDELFLMIPHRYTADDNASIAIDFWDGYATHTVTASLTDTEWKAGETVTYELSSRKLTTLQVQSITYATTVSGAPRTNWQTDDRVGMYVVQGTDANGNPDGHTLRYKNIPVTATVDETGVTWSVDHTTGQGPVYKYPGDSYYFYYPYQEGTPTGYPNECNEVGASAETFFSSVINGHQVETDQQSITNFIKSDLQVSKAVLPEDEDSNLPASTIKATMARQVGLAVISLGTDQANKTKVFTNNNAGEVTETASVTASDTFSGNIPYNNSSAYYAYVKAGTATTFSSAVYSDTNKDAWAESLVFTVAAGNSDSQTAHSARKNWEYINAVWNYSYTANNCYTWTSAPQGTNSYTMECWGAQGTNYDATYQGGKGGYTKGTLSLNTTLAAHLYIYCGQQPAAQSVTGGWNGGGTGLDNGHTVADEKLQIGYGGGGATDIRLTDGDWNNFSSLQSRIMVAAGGAGNAMSVQHLQDSRGGHGIPGYAGGLIGGDGSDSSIEAHGLTFCGSGATQTEPGNSLNDKEKIGDQIISESGQWKGGFGYGGSPAVGYYCGGGGGSGYYGGGASTRGHGAGGGGSSFISGHEGCDAITETSTADAITHTGEPNHYSGKVFTNTLMIAGNATQTKPGGGTETGHSGNGYARITLTRW